MRQPAVVALAFASAFASACGGGKHRSDTASESHVEKATRGEVSNRVLLTGTLRATQSEELRVPRTQVWELPIRWMAADGAPVKAGDRALEFDNGSFVSTLAEKKISYLDALMQFHTFEQVSSLDEVQKQFELDNAKLLLAKATVQASVPADLLPARTAQERQLEQKRAGVGVDKAEKALASTKAANALERQVKQIELDKAKTIIDDAESSIKELVLVAPRDGTVVIENHPWMERKFQVGDSVQPGWTIVSLPASGSPMEVHAELSDVDDGRVSVGMQGTCTLDAYPGVPVPCTVKELMPVASAKVGGQSLRRGFAVVLSVEKPDQERMRPGMAVKVELARPPLRSVVVVPRRAIRWDKDKASVRVAGGVVRPVEITACDSQRCAVQKGVSEGDSVVVGGEP